MVNINCVMVYTIYTYDSGVLGGESYFRGEGVLKVTLGVPPPLPPPRYCLRPEIRKYIKQKYNISVKHDTSVNVQVFVFLKYL